MKSKSVHSVLLPWSAREQILGAGAQTKACGEKLWEHSDSARRRSSSRTRVLDMFAFTKLFPHSHWTTRIPGTGLSEEGDMQVVCQ